MCWFTLSGIVGSYRQSLGLSIFRRGKDSWLGGLILNTLLSKVTLRRFDRNTWRCLFPTKQSNTLLSVCLRVASTVPTMMRHGLHNPRLSSTTLIPRNKFTLSHKLLSTHLQRSSIAAPKASPSFTVRPMKQRHDLLFSEGPSPPMFTPNNGGSSGSGDVSDREWQIRTGRAIYILQKTLPDFFDVGLVSNIDPTKTPALIDSRELSSPEVENIYSPKVRLTYTPPVALPSPFPRTLGLEGLPLYLASSVFIRHTMRTLYSDLRVELRRVIVQGSPSSHSESAVAGTHLNHQREKSVFIGLDVHGTTRVSGGVGKWQIDSTYSFSPLSGLIQTHTINSIHPAPHQAAYDALRASLSSVFGFGGPGPSDIRPGEVQAVDSEKG
ncbi:uncharacterized protein EDB91DRAFT_1164024 [Suillus paluster]|uniref:uncharacterized protein n=1 Tax=Suillus paluster TaxID=48578 RepID=UPI001B87166F|nr:uncharacterized protein EDB91DRAFT_1164024 [Suillus paluster]KAG1727483.1 hypothetical protein EDB91DRAFT_1164024 [Suillus paluster]